jgi:luciferase family oxidoreductase group 1
MLLIENKGFPDSHPFSRVRAMPSDVALPPLFLLGSSDYSAKLAASIGAGFSFAHHFASHDAADAMQTYRVNFQPSALLPKPYAILAVAAVCAGSESDAERIAATADLNIVRRAKGDYLPLESPEAALAHPYTPIDRDRIAQNRERLFVGTPDAVKSRLMSLASAAGADEIMVTGMIYDHAARKNSYALLAQAFGLRGG